MKDGRVVVGMNVNVWDVKERVRSLIRSRQRTAVVALHDSDVPLEMLVAEPATSR
jgi:hypothetical protein